MMTVLARADLKFTRTSLVDQICEEAGAVTRTFPFEAVGKGGTRVLKVAPSCTCTTADLPNTVYLPGERGTVTMHYDPSGKQGPQAVFIDVETEAEGRKANTRLIYRANVIRAISVQPEILYWKIEEAADQKVVSVSVDPSLKPKSLTLGKTPDYFTAELREVRDGYLLEVTPKRPMKPAKEEIHVALEDESGKRFERTLHLLIR
jgi:hypothetical protein